MHLFSWDLMVPGLLFSQPVFWGKGLPRCYSGNPVWAELPCAPVVGDGLSGNQSLGLLFSGAFPWQLSTSLPRVRAEETICKPLPQSRETAVCSSLCSLGHIVSISVRAAINCSVLGCAPLRSAPSPASSRGTSLPFVLLKPPAAPSSWARGSAALGFHPRGCSSPARPQRTGFLSRRLQFTCARLCQSGFPPRGLQFTSMTPAHWVSISEAAVRVRATLAPGFCPGGCSSCTHDPTALVFHPGGCPKVLSRSYRSVSLCPVPAWPAVPFQERSHVVMSPLQD